MCADAFSACADGPAGAVSAAARPTGSGRHSVYLDANASMPLRPACRAAVIEALNHVGNPSSPHAAGRRARALLERARDEVARLLRVPCDSVLFTSGATEAAGIALTLDFGSRKLDRLLVSAVEHDCVLAGGRVPREKISIMPVDEDGVLQPETVARHLEEAGEERCLVAVMLANNETGVVQPVAEISRLVQAKEGVVLCDAVQAVGRMGVDANELGADLMIMSSHKLGGPKGAGALVLVDRSLTPRPLVAGGGQERRMRPGTECLPAICGFGVAARESADHMRFGSSTGRMRHRLEEGLRRATPDVFIAGAEAARLPNTTLACLDGLSAQTAVMALDLAGFEVSAGSACSSGKTARSHVLEAMGVRHAGGGVRMSLHPDLREDHIDAFVAAWGEMAVRLRRAAA